MLCIILEATLHEKHNGAGEGREVKRAEPRVQVQGRSAQHTSARVLRTDAKSTRKINRDQMWWHTSVTPVLGDQPRLHAGQNPQRNTRGSASSSHTWLISRGCPKGGAKARFSWGLAWGVRASYQPSHNLTPFLSCNPLSKEVHPANRVPSTFS